MDIFVPLVETGEKVNKLRGGRESPSIINTLYSRNLKLRTRNLRWVAISGLASFLTRTPKSPKKKTFRG